MKWSIVFFLSLLSPLYLSSCATEDRFASISPKFLDGIAPEQRIENLPFQHSWVSPSLSKTKVPEGEQLFKSIYIKPIRSDLIDPAGWKQSQGTLLQTQEEYNRLARNLAFYFHSRLSDALKFHKKRRFRVVRSPQENSLIIEIAITELVFSLPVARAGSLAAPVPGTGAALSAISDPHVAFAMKVIDPRGNRLIATVADRKFSPVRILDLNKLTITSSPREIVQNWSKELGDTFQYGRFHSVEERGVVKILPW